MGDPYEPVVNVEPPPQDPEETKRVFHELGKRKPWSLYGESEEGSRVVPPSPPVGPPDHTGREDPDEGDRPHPFPVAEVDLSEAQERMVKPDELVCWKCGTKDGVRKLPENGAELCSRCEDILKP